MTDSMQDLIEQKFSDLLVAASGLDALQVVYRGEPGIVPVRLYPFGVVFLTRSSEAIAGADGYGPETGVRFWRHEGYIGFEVLFKDTSTLVPDANRQAVVGSYDQAKELAKVAVTQLDSWDPDADMLDLPANPRGNHERTTGELYFDELQNAMTSRAQDTTANRSFCAFHLYSEEMLGG